ncbi:uncharacterized protein E6C27_scaffold22G002530 [Cucumis melo var. makuwa]|uniref:Uncharacterized protein n=1 Tax=Cucumis melo var. makuwa TaxID=1194695 RepID=A0A5A7UZ99_CUCMM|nr:uncharacterized protein E6C27_scaffold22G002530 [Cucumis melo var. makuwa]
MPRPKSLHIPKKSLGTIGLHSKNAFDSIKKYLLNPPILGAPIPGKPLISYITAQERSLGALLAQEKEKGKERALYYLSRTLAFTAHLVAKADPIKYVLSRPIISRRLAKWAVLVQQYDIVYISQKAIKGQALADFSTDHPIPDWKLCEDLPDDEVFFTKALIIGLQMALEIGVSLIEIYGDSKLIINQLSLQYDVKHKDLKPYFTYARQLMERFDSVMLENVPRTENKRADALAKLVTALMKPDNVALNIPLCQRWIMPPILPECQEANVTTSHLIDEEYWAQPIIEYLEYGKLPKDSRHKTEEESIKALNEAHVGVCGAHQSGPKLQFQLRRIGYYLPKMVQDSIDYAKKCEACQYHANFIHQPLEPLHPIVASWPFEAWGLDLVDPITLKSSAGHSYIIVATDYFSKWTEAIPLREAKKKNVANFICTHIIYRYAVNGLVEAFNKTLCNLLKKIVSESKRNWQERIDEPLWAYRTTHRTPTRVTPYTLVYSAEAVLPLEREISSLRGVDY